MVEQYVKIELVDTSDTSMGLITISAELPSNFKNELARTPQALTEDFKDPEGARIKDFQFIPKGDEPN